MSSHLYLLLIGILLASVWHLDGCLGFPLVSSGVVAGPGRHQEGLVEWRLQEFAGAIVRAIASVSAVFGAWPIA